MIGKGTIERIKEYCKDNIEEIEGYNEAIISNKRYVCHHKLGIEVDREELIDKGLYYHRPANELVFLEFGEHTRLHNLNLREETRKKLSDVHKGKHIGEKNGMYGRTGEKHPKAKQCTINGTTYDCLKDAHKALYPNMSHSTFYYKYSKGEL